MHTLKQWSVLAVLVAIALLAGGWFLLISPERSEAAALHEQADLQRAANDQKRTQLTVLRGKAEALPDEERDLAEVARKIPAEPGLPSLLRALTAAGRSAGVEVVTITPGAPTPVVAAAAAAPAPAAPAGAAPAPAAPAAGGLSSISLSISVRGGFAEVEQYVAELEELPRALRITGLTVAPGGGGEDGGAAAASGRSLTSTLTGSVFLAPAAAAAPATAAAAPVTTPVVDPSAPAS